MKSVKEEDTKETDSLKRESPQLSISVFLRVAADNSKSKPQEKEQIDFAPFFKICTEKEKTR